MDLVAWAVPKGTRQIDRSRLLLRRPTPVWPFVWRGLLPFLGLLVLLVYAIWPFAKGEIEDNVRRSVTKALQDQGLDGVNVLVTGQQVFLSGEIKPSFNTLQVLNIAREAKCPTWLGPQVCAEMVLGQFVQVPAVPSAGVSVPSVNLPQSTAENKANCEAAFASALRNQRIEFDTGSARLLPTSQAVIDQVAKVHGSCAGVVRVEGHTDNRGSETSNQRLSQARAEAVRSELVRRGIAADRLQAAGFGAAQPVADNATAEGRQTNRRIEFKVVTAP